MDIHYRVKKWGVERDVIRISWDHVSSPIWIRISQITAFRIVERISDDEVDFWIFFGAEKLALQTSWDNFVTMAISCGLFQTDGEKYEVD